MSRTPVIPAVKKIRIVLSIIAGEVTVAEAAHKEKVSEESIGRWKAALLETGKAARVVSSRLAVPRAHHTSTKTLPRASCSWAGAPVLAVTNRL